MTLEIKTVCYLLNTKFEPIFKTQKGTEIHKFRKGGYCVCWGNENSCDLYMYDEEVILRSFDEALKFANFIDAFIMEDSS